jgi:hypothetical protein
MNKRLQFLQKYFCINPEDDFGYLVITEIVDGIPVGSFVVKIPVAFKFYEETHSYYATTPN